MISVRLIMLFFISFSILISPSFSQDSIEAKPRVWFGEPNPNDPNVRTRIAIGEPNPNGRGSNTIRPNKDQPKRVLLHVFYPVDKERKDPKVMENFLGKIKGKADAWRLNSSDKSVVVLVDEDKAWIVKTALEPDLRYTRLPNAYEPSVIMTGRG